MQLKYESVEELVSVAEQLGKTISEVVLADQAQQLNKSQTEIFNRMLENLQTMQQAVSVGFSENLRSDSGLSGGDALKMKEYVETGNIIGGSTLGKVLMKAIAVAEVNACMGRIVAAPTAGSCGIIPGVLLTIMEEQNLAQEKVVMGLFTSAGIGMVIAKVASISGAEGGCQAECGSASAMAAAALVELYGGTPRMIAQSCALALKNMLGLVCDPVAGLVEVPCIKRNAIGAVNALTAANMAMAGVQSVIPVDEVILAMKEVGDLMASSVKETSDGGLAATPTGRKLTNELVDLHSVC